MSKHTPGPWRAGKTGGAVVSDTAIEHGPGGCDCVEYYGGHLIGESIAKCNVALIAAAPELLHAAKHALESAESVIHEYLDGTRALKQALAELQPVRDVIAKAEGEA